MKTNTRKALLKLKQFCADNGIIDLQASRDGVLARIVSKGAKESIEFTLSSWDMEDGSRYFQIDAVEDVRTKL